MVDFNSHLACKLNVLTYRPGDETLLCPRWRQTELPSILDIVG